MKRVFRWFAVGGSVGVLALGVAALESLRPSGSAVRPAAPNAVRCKEISLGASAADLQIDRQRGLVYLSYLDRGGLAAGKSVSGTVMLVDLAAPEPRPRAALTHDPPDFRPAAMSLYSPPGAPQRLFVISHRPAAVGGPLDSEDTIEILEQSPAGGFRPLDTVRDPRLVDPQAIVAVGPRAFYVADRAGTRGAWSRALAWWFPWRGAKILYDDGTALRPVIVGIASATGLALSPDGRRLYLSEGPATRIAVYARDPASGALTPEREVVLGSRPAAIDVDPQGDLWVAAQPRILDLWRHLSDPTHTAPTQVLRISPRDWQPVEEFRDSGKGLSAGSAAVSDGNGFLIGAVRDSKLLRCERS